MADHDSVWDRTESVRRLTGSATSDGVPTTGAGPAPADGADRTLPDRIGSYRILGLLGKGGMGVVYEAEQESPRRRVAVKVVRGGPVIDDVQVRMFEREVDTLARLQHPNIGAIYESGRTAEGRHFFAMELVRGDTLDVYLNRRGHVATSDEIDFRLALFAEIADAVHYAHQRGVIHRDLKPSNIVVTESDADEEFNPDSKATSGGAVVPHVKILDFGLARITEGDVRTATLTAEVGVIRGTLPYMSPEQTRGDPGKIDLRTDVYALGVMLYEMLSGRRPYELARTPLADAVRVICEVPPEPLNRSLREVRRVDRDIETIVAKALEKDADRRYPSAAALSQDVMRYLSSQPILARPPSTSYQLRKFASRNRALVGGVAVAALALVAGVIVSTVFGMREAAERREAERARRDLEQVVEFQSMMLSGVEPEGVGRRLMSDLRDRVSAATRTRGGTDADVAAVLETFDASFVGVNSTDAALRMIDDEILGRAEATIADEVSDQPLIEARLRHTIGVTYSALGLYEPAERQLRRAIELRRAQLGDEAPETLTSLDELALVLRIRGRFDEATEVAERTLGVRSRTLGPNHPDTLTAASTLAAVYASLGRLGPAEELYARTLDVQRRVIGPEHPDTMSTMNDLGVLHDKQNRYREAEELLTATLQLRRRTLGNDAKATLSTMNNLAMAYAHEGRSSEARELFSEVLATQRRVLGDAHSDTLAAMNNLALTYASERRFADAEVVHQRALTLRREVLGPEHPDTVVSMTNLASTYAAWGRNEEAEQLDRAALDIRMRTLGPEHPDTLVSMNNLAVLLRDEGRYEEAEPLLRQALDTRVRVTGSVHRETDRVRRNLIALYRLEGRTDRLRPLVSDMLATVRSAAGRDDALPSELNDAAWQLLTAEPEDLRDPVSGLEIARRACELEERGQGPELWNFLDTLALAWHLNGDTQAAVATERRALMSLSPGRPERAALERQLAEFESALARQRATSGG